MSGFAVAGTIELGAYCDRFPAVHSFIDGSLLIFDGERVLQTTSDGLVLRDYGPVGGTVFPTFMKVDPGGAHAYFGESSSGAIRSLDLATGQMQVLTSLTFNYDLAFDVVPGLAYVSASAFGSATNSVFLLDLLSGQATQVADLGGFAGPLEVNDQGDLFAAVLPDSFPFPPDDTKIVRFSAAQLMSGSVLTDELDGFDFTVGFDGMSSADYLPGEDALIVVETNTSTSGSGSAVWKIDSQGEREWLLADAPSYASGCQVFDTQTGASLAPYQPTSTAIRVGFRDCSGSAGYKLWTVAPSRPGGYFSGPGAGQAGPATVGVFGGVPNGYASLWLARSGSVLSTEMFTSLGGAYPMALAATPASFGRRFPLRQLSAVGGTQFTYAQTSVFSGAAMFQWVVFDASMQPVGTSTHVFN